MSERIKRNGSIVIVCGVIGIFLKITSNLDSIQIIAFLISGWIVFASTKAKKNRIRYSGGGLALIVCIFFSVLAYFPVFENSPNIDEFINRQSRHIQVTSNTSTSSIIIKQGGFSKKQEIINTKKEISLKESPVTTITFTNNQKPNEANMTIQFGDQTTIYIYPNTTFSILTSGSQKTIENIHGQMEYMQGISDDIVVKNANLKKISDFAAKGLWNSYGENLRTYVLDLAGGAIMENDSVRKTAHNIVILGSKIRPNKYLPYLKNEKKYTEMLGWTTTPKTEYEAPKTETTDNIIENAKLGGSKTRFLHIFNTDE